MNDGGSITDFIVTLHKSRMARKENNRPFVSKNIDTVSGKLTIKSMAMVKGLTSYSCLCECGNMVGLSYHQLMSRGRTDSGCLLPDCSISLGEDLIQTDMDTCLKDQFKRMLAYYPSNVCGDWGGDNIVDLPSAYESFYNYIIDIGADRTIPNWFIVRIDEVEDFEPGNLKLVSKDELDGKAGELIFSYESNVLTIEEAVGILGCTKEDIISLQEAMISDEDIYESFA